MGGLESFLSQAQDWKIGEKGKGKKIKRQKGKYKDKKIKRVLSLLSQRRKFLLVGIFL